MNFKGKTAVCALIILTVSLLFGSTVLCESPTPIPSQILDDQALLCLTTVYNLDFSHYNITHGDSFTLPPRPDNQTVDQAIDYFLSSADSNLIAHFDFENGVLNQFALRIMSGSVVAAQNFSSMSAAATDFLTKYQIVNSVDMTPLIRLVGMLSQTNSSTATLGNLTLQESSGSIISGHYMTSFTWRNKPDDACIDLIFDNGAFYTFTEFIQFTAADSAQAMNAPFDAPVPTDSPSPTTTPTPGGDSQSPAAVQQPNQNPSAKTNNPLETNSFDSAVILAFLAIIAACVGIIVYMKKRRNA